MPLKKSQLYSSLWKSCDELRGGMDATQYKDYILVLLFVKYVSDKAASQKNYLLTVPKGGSFADMVALKGSVEIGDKMNKIISRLADANELKGIIDVADFNDEDKLGKGKEMVDRLSKLVGIFADPNLDFRANRADGDDLLGDAYEYLMRHFATESGKSKGQFYTPSEVSRVMAQVIGLGTVTRASQTIHDPTCGSGSLLLKAHDEAKARTGKDLALYGQEKDNATKALARMNMILHDCPTAEIWQDNTLSSPYFKDKNGRLMTFDFVVANPPFSDKAWSNGLLPSEDEFHRFEYGVPPEKNGDFAYLLHVLACLKSTGKGAIILPHGVLFRGGAEATIRKELVRRGFIKGIIGLPANLFYGTGIPACIVVIDKENAHARQGIFMMDASAGFLKDGNKNRLRDMDVHKIVDVFTKRLDVPKYSRMVGLAEIEKNEFNLNLPRYIDTQVAEDIQDIGAHLHGGIPLRDVDALSAYWEVFPTLRSTLFEDGASLSTRHAHGFAPEYFQTRFHREESWDDWPDQFAIITAYATTREKWPASANVQADHELEALLLKQSSWVRRLTGYSPYTGHAEPGWAVQLPFEKACDVGQKFRQDAIYCVDGDDLTVSHCDKRRKQVKVSPFRTRVDSSRLTFVSRPGYLNLVVDRATINAAIYGHPEFTAFITQMNVHFEKWRNRISKKLKALEKGLHPKELITELSENLLAHYANQPLLDKYDIYQHLRDYWAETMQDDCYGIAAEGWKAETYRILETDKNGKEKDRGWTCDLIPKSLIVATYFSKEQDAISQLQAELEAVSAQLTELEEEHGGDEGALALEKVNKAAITANLRKLRDDDAEEHSSRKGGRRASATLAVVTEEAVAYGNGSMPSEVEVLLRWLKLNQKETDLKGKLREAEDKLDALALAKFPKLTESDVQKLVVDLKWLAALDTDVHSEMDRISRTLTSRIRQLAERYATPLPQLTDEVATLAARLDEHLKKMGVVWK